MDDEGQGDTDNDGIPNQFDLDSDGDGCFDVIEASFSDTDNDGILGADPVVVNEDGLVISLQMEAILTLLIETET